MIETQAGGVRGLGVESNFALAPFSINCFKKGIVTPTSGRSRIISLITVKVAPSNPINNVFVITPLRLID